MTTIAARILELEERRIHAEREQEVIERLLRALPQDMPAPTVSNVSPTAFFGTGGAWLSWRSSYSEPINGSHVLALLEVNGFRPVPVTVCKWDHWLPCAEPGLWHEIPDEKGRYKLTTHEAVAPLWLEANNFTPPEAIAFYRIPYPGPFGIVRVMVPAPTRFSVHARKIESPGDWRFDRGTARLAYPPSWEVLRNANDERVAARSQLTIASIQTEKGLLGRLYWSLDVEQESFPLTPAQVLAQLEEGQR